MGQTSVYVCIFLCKRLLACLPWTHKTKPTVHKLCACILFESLIFGTRLTIWHRCECGWFRNLTNYKHHAGCCLSNHWSHSWLTVVSSLLFSDNIALSLDITVMSSDHVALTHFIITVTFDDDISLSLFYIILWCLVIAQPYHYWCYSDIQW